MTRRVRALAAAAATGVRAEVSELSPGFVPNGENPRGRRVEPPADDRRFSRNSFISRVCRSSAARWARLVFAGFSITSATAPAAMTMRFCASRAKTHRHRRRRRRRSDRNQRRRARPPRRAGTLRPADERVARKPSSRRAARRTAAGIFSLWNKTMKALETSARTPVAARPASARTRRVTTRRDFTGSACASRISTISNPLNS